MTSNNVATLEPRKSVLLEMAGRFGMEPGPFEATLRATVVPASCTKEQFAAFLLVAREYGLNPITKEIYAFPAKGGIQPVVSIDGWMNLVNSHPAMNGLEFDDHLDGDRLTAVTARIWRKDREHPIVVTEYLIECQKDTEPWKKWPRRMLRHKAAIQCARYAFGFAGIVDPDEAERMGADVSRMQTVPVPPAPPPPRAAPVLSGQTSDAPTEIEVLDPDKFLEDAESQLAAAGDIPTLNEVWVSQIEPRLSELFPPDRDRAKAIYARHEERVAL